MHSFSQQLLAYTNYQMHDQSLLQLALTHSSAPSSHDKEISNSERLEFLGDAVLGLVISEWLYTEYPHEQEGDLAKRRAGLVCQKELVAMANHLKLGHYVGIQHSNEDGTHNPTILETTMEALLGAIFLDGGYGAAKQVIHQLWRASMSNMKTPPQDPKSSLQEWSQSQGLGLPIYRLVETTGPSHAPLFTIEVSVMEANTPLFAAQATASNKREAEKEAATKLLAVIHSQHSK